MAGHEVQVGAATVDRRAKGEIAAGPRLAAGVVVVLVGIQRRRPDRLHHRLKSRPRSDERFGPFAVPTPDMRGRLHDRQEEPDDQDGHRHGHEEFEQGEGPPGHAGTTAPAQMAGGRPGAVRCHRWFIAGAKRMGRTPAPRHWRIRQYSAPGYCAASRCSPPTRAARARLARRSTGEAKGVLGAPPR